MATSQLTTYNADGSIQFDSQLQTYSLAYTYQVPVTFFANIQSSSGVNEAISIATIGKEYANFPFDDSDLAVIEVLDGYWYGVAKYDYTQGYYGFNAQLSLWTNQPAGSMATFYVYRETRKVSNPSSFGLQLADDQGRVTYDSNKYPSKIIALMTSGDSYPVSASGKYGASTGSMAWIREIDPSVGTQYWKDTYPTVRRNGATVSSFPLIFTNSSAFNRFPVGVYVNLQQQDIVMDLSSIDMSLVGSVPPPPANASRTINGTDFLASAALRITVGSTIALQHKSTVTHRSSNENQSSSVSVECKMQYRNLSINSGWTDVPGGSQTTTAGEERHGNGEPPTINTGIINISTSLNASSGHVLEFRAIYATTPALAIGLRDTLTSAVSAP